MPGKRKPGPYDGITDRDALLKILRAGRNEGARKLTKMLKVLETEAEHAKKSATRVNSAARHAALSLQCAHGAYELESGQDAKQSGGGPTIQILISLPNGETRAPTEDEYSTALSSLSDQLRAKRTKALVPGGDE